LSATARSNKNLNEWILHDYCCDQVFSQLCSIQSGSFLLSTKFISTIVHFKKEWFYWLIFVHWNQKYFFVQLIIKLNLMNWIRKSSSTKLISNCLLWNCSVN
jgi:hypothetical protein